MYRIPAEFVNEEKIFGGKFTLRQFVFSVSGGLLAALVFTLPVFFPIRVFIALIFVAIGLSLSFITVREVDLLTFVLRFIRYKLRPKDTILIMTETPYNSKEQSLRRS